MTKATFHIVANQWAIDLANTEVLEAGERIDLIPDFGSLLDWLTVSGALAEPDRDRVQQRFTWAPLADIALAEAKRLRRAAGSLVESAISGRAVPGAVVDEINRFLKDGAGYRELVREPEGFSLHSRSQLDTPLKLLAPVAASAAELLVHGDLRLIKKCENPECILHIYDTTKNRSRRWCAMSACGNRSKVGAFRRRSRSGV